eukprot:CAMPEP_0182888110 /NCGR_PEP_ID=MMETSP0034_2-20130328/21239_1 /TAXON_ID=156128 /ORGANISM="Nephroselmis pyriformis, Strain CCMP717" /LENGTH=283 /DNA_ID=CAMNT_0025021519 /DNA_START=34 /DNA_END=881 /DNA_ORIENTATION=-
MASVALDGYTNAVIKFLQGHAGVGNVEFHRHDGCSQADIAIWEAKNAPYKLPHEYVSFLQVSDGFSLTWDVHFDAEVRPLGRIHLNGLADLTRVPLLCCAEDDDDGDELLKVHNLPGTTPVPAAAFDLDARCMGGRVALVYGSPADAPRVWFQDLSGGWNFMAKGFSDYFRIMTMHLGLPTWQYAFTEVGLDPIAKQWFNFLTPERLEIDMDTATMNKSPVKRAKGSARKSSGKKSSKSKAKKAAAPAGGGGDASAAIATRPPPHARPLTGNPRLRAPFRETG